MRTTRISRAALAVAMSVFVLAFAGCQNPFAPPGGGDDDDVEVQYKTRTSPENVIYNLNTAYEYMNIEEYLDCLAEEFEFHLAEVDLDDDATLPEYWGKATEQSVHRKMFGIDPVPDPNDEVEQITLTLTTITYEYNQGADPDDPMDDRWTYLMDTDLMVWFPNNLQRRADADVEFVFRIDPLETGPDGETLYEIIRWEDLATAPGGRHSTQPVTPDVEETTFGRVKANYLP
ncbi:MAG: hypothetical protein GF405_02810 [Candidatus Eisenbacteria bacterium]|nr:hypothetical protein [Candidatus Eisenbacteria bacterium]